MTKRLNIDIIAKDKSQLALKKVQGNLAKVKSSVFNLRNALVGLGAGLVLRQIANVSAEFEDLRDSLASVTGSVDAGREAFDFIKDFATRTQFGVQELTRSFITLKASGIQPTEELLRVFTDTAAVTTDQLGTLDALTRVFSRGVQGGLGLEELNQIADRGVPVFRLLEEQLGITRLEISKFGQTTEGAEKILNALQTSLGKEFAGATEQKLDNLSTATSNFQIALANAADSFGEAGFSGALTEAFNKLTQFIEFIDPAIRKIGEFTGAVISLTIDGIELVGDTADFVANTFKKLLGVTDELGGANEELQKTQESVNESLEQGKELLSDFRDVTLDNTYAIQGMSAELDNSTIPSVKKYNDNLMQTLGRARDLKTQFDDLAANTFNNFANTLADTLMTGKLAFKDFARSLLADIARIIARQLALLAIQRALGFMGVPFPNMVGVGMPSFGGFRANGGNVQAGQAYMVGERGAELFLPQQSGTIIPNEKVNTGTTNINFTINTVDAQGVDELLTNRRSTIINVINDALNRQGKEALV